jgi:hypothetical protein
MVLLARIPDGEESPPLKGSDRSYLSTFVMSDPQIANIAVGLNQTVDPKSVSKDDSNAKGAAIPADVAVDTVEESQWTTTTSELWSYYLYYIGNNGLSGFNFGPSQFQNLLFLAGYDPTVDPPFSAPCGDGGCVLPYLGRVRDSLCLHLCS